MPGFAAVVGEFPLELADQLTAAFRFRWPDASVARGARVAVSAHAFGGREAVVHSRDGGIVAVDGEFTSYDALSAWTKRDSRALASSTDRTNECVPEGVGTLLLAEPDLGCVSVTSDMTGTFPLYYAVVGNALLVSTLIKPIAIVLGASYDVSAVQEFLRAGYLIGAKTFFQRIGRLLPGQRLRYSPGAGVNIEELSRAWVSDDSDNSDLDPEYVLETLVDAVRCTLWSRSNVLMMSGGWDSRTLLAAARAAGMPVSCYSHGDLASRELRIVGGICERLDVHLRRESIDDRVLDPLRLASGFARAENVVFPHWHRAGELISAEAATVITAGVLGEVLGGHYGPAALSSAFGKAGGVAALLLGGRTAQRMGRRLDVREVLHIRSRERDHWYLASDAQAAIRDTVQLSNGAVEGEIDRLRARGVSDPLAQVEAFITEHRGSQYINAQIRSCRAYADVAVPFGNAALFTLAAAAPLWAKVHNRMNQSVLRLASPELLAFPFAATLVSAGWPVLLQEASRLVRKGLSMGTEVLARGTQGRVETARTGWVNFEFLRDGRSLTALVDGLLSDLWDKGALRRRISSLSDSSRPAPHPLYDQLSKIHTVDLMLR